MLEEFVSMMDVILMGLLIAPYLILSGIIGYLLYRIEKNEKPLEKNDTNLKLTKDRFSCWECTEDEDYEQKFDDELIIKIYSSETSKQIADYILECQEKADDYDKMVNITFDLTNRVKKCENEYQPMNELIKENKELRKLLSVFEDES